MADSRIQAVHFERKTGAPLYPVDRFGPAAASSGTGCIMDLRDDSLSVF